MQKNPTVTISVINYNDRKFIFKAIESAINQTYPNLDIIITDNNSTDGTREEIEKRIPEWEEIRKEMCKSHNDSAALQDHESGKARKFNNSNGLFQIPFIKYIKNSENAGFGRPHNQAIRIAIGDFILLLNSDAMLLPDYIKNAIKPFDDPKVSSVQGKLLRYNFDKNELYKDENNPKLSIIDTTGLLMFKNRRIVCIGQGQSDKGQFEKETEVFGADGAAPIYRKSALEDVKLPIIRNCKLKSSKFQVPSFKFQDYEYFDENFFMYKEDVDLAWRMRLYGWKAVYAPKAISYHGRGSGDSMAKNYLDIIKERRKINVRAKHLSFKHQRLMQIKNDFPSLLFTKHFPQFIIKEIGAWVYMAIFERFTFRVLKDLYCEVPLFLKKRKMVMANKRVSAKEMEKWFY